MGGEETNRSAKMANVWRVESQGLGTSTVKTGPCSKEGTGKPSLHLKSQEREKKIKIKKNKKHFFFFLRKLGHARDGSRIIY